MERQIISTKLRYFCLKVLYMAYDTNTLWKLYNIRAHHCEILQKLSCSHTIETTICTHCVRGPIDYPDDNYFFKQFLDKSYTYPCTCS